MTVSFNDTHAKKSQELLTELTPCYGFTVSVKDFYQIYTNASFPQWNIETKKKKKDGIKVLKTRFMLVASAQSLNQYVY